MPWVPQFEGDFPTLGWHVADQMAEYLGRPDAGDDEQSDPFIVTREQQDYLNELYRLDPMTGKRVIHRSVMMRPRGWGKSPFVGGIMIAEALFEVVPDGWDSNGQPVAKPWSKIRTPYVAIAAVTEEQTKNTWEPLLEMLRNGTAPDEFNCDPMDSFVALERGRIAPITASPLSIKGFKAVAASLDQTETWLRGNSGVKLAQTLRNNATKLGGVTIETPNAYTLGERSVAESSYEFWDKIKSGKHQALEDVRSIYFDHRVTPATDIGDRESLIEGLRVAYGDSAKDPRGCVLHDPPCSPGWSDLERIADDFLDTSNDPAQMRADFLNQVDSARDAFVSEAELRAVLATKEISRSEAVTLGFDGSEGRKRGIADSTVLVGYSVAQKHIFKVGLWEQPEGPRGEGWKPPKDEIDAKVRQTVAKDFHTVGFYGDPSAGWAGDVKAWEASFHTKLKAKVTASEPIRWKQREVTRTCETFDQLYSMIRNGEITIENDPDLIRHFLNARRDPRRAGYVLKKADDNQDFGKIDLTWGAMFALAAGLDAVGEGVGSARRKAPRRLR